MAALVQESLERHHIEAIKHPLYSQNLSSCNFYFFPSLKCELCGQDFETDTEVI